MRQLAGAVLLAVVEALVLPSTTQADNRCRPVNGSFEAHIVALSDCSSPVGLCTSGRVWGGLPGAGATGQIRLRGELDAVNGITSGDYIGELCRGH